MVTATARLGITLNTLPLLATAGVNKAEEHGLALGIDFGICSSSAALVLSSYSAPNTTTTHNAIPRHSTIASLGHGLYQRCLISSQDHAALA